MKRATLDLTHELTNRINGPALTRLAKEVGSGKISPEKYALGNLGIESKGIVNQIIVAHELKYSVSEAGNNPYYQAYVDGKSEPDLLKSVYENIKTLEIAANQMNAFEYYKLQGKEYRKKMIDYQKEVNKYNKRYKK